MGEWVPAAPQCVQTRKTGVTVDRVVIHVMEGTLAGTVAWFQRGDRPVPTAAHFLVGADGRVVQMVRMADKCYHANDYNSRSIGIEHEGYTAKGEFTLPMYKASARLIAREILPRYPAIRPDRTHIIGHNEVPGATHTDPGNLWDWNAFMALLVAECNAGARFA